jgi:hypothetical protein
MIKCKVNGFVPYGTEKRQYLERHSDLGDTYFALSDCPEKENCVKHESNCQRYRNLIQWIGKWHERKAILMLIYKILMAAGVSPLLSCHGWTSPSQWGMIAECGSVKKSTAFIRDVLNESMLCALHIETANSLVKLETEVTVADVINYIEDDQNDLSFKNHISNFKLVNNFENCIAGSRNCYMDQSAAGELFYLPYMMPCNNLKYAPAIIREISVLQYQAPEAIRSNRRTFFTFGCSKIDYDEQMEFFNHKQKVILPDGPPNAFGISFSALFIFASEHLLGTLYRALGIEQSKVREVNLKQDLSVDIKSVTKYLLDHNVFKKTRDRNVCMDFSGSKIIKSERTALQLHAYGQRALQTYAYNYLHDIEPNPFPKPIEMVDPKPIINATTVGVASTLAVGILVGFISFLF